MPGPRDAQGAAVRRARRAEGRASAAMKMETRVEAPVAGTLRQVAAVGDVVSVGQAIARVD